MLLDTQGWPGLCPVCLWWLAVRGSDYPSEVQKVVINSVSLLALLSDRTNPLLVSFGISYGVFWCSALLDSFALKMSAIQGGSTGKERAVGNC